MSASVERKLAAILAADVVGYSRLMEGDEAGTLERLKQIRREVIDPAIKAKGGRIIKVVGDSMLAEFPSAVDAVASTVSIQEAVAARNLADADQPVLEFRVGINLGDVIVDGDDLYGDGVNLAARLETLAEPGGLCVSDTVRQHIASKIDIHLEDAGEQKLKNIERPIRVWRWSADRGPTDKRRRVAIVGRAEEGVALAERAFRLSPHDPLEAEFYSGLGYSLFFAGRYEEAVEACDRSVQLNRERGADIVGAAALVRLGRLEPARKMVRGIIERGGEMTLERMFWPHTAGNQWGQLIDALREVYEPSGEAG